MTSVLFPPRLDMLGSPQCRALKSVPYQFNLLQRPPLDSPLLSPTKASSFRPPVASIEPIGRRPFSSFSLFLLLHFARPNTRLEQEHSKETMLLGIGVDLLSLARLRAVVARRGADKLALRILSTEERSEWEKQRGDPAWTGDKQEQYLASR